MADVELVTPDGRRKTYPSHNGPIRVDSTNVPVVKHWAGRSLFHSLSEVVPAPHLVAVQATIPHGRTFVAHPIQWSQKMSKLVHFLDEGLRAHSDIGRWLPLRPVGELPTSNGQESVHS